MPSYRARLRDLAGKNGSLIFKKAMREKLLPPIFEHETDGSESERYGNEASSSASERQNGLSQVEQKSKTLFEYMSSIRDSIISKDNFNCMDLHSQKKFLVTNQEFERLRDEFDGFIRLGRLGADFELLYRVSLKNLRECMRKFHGFQKVIQENLEEQLEAVQERTEEQAPTSSVEATDNDDSDNNSCYSSVTQRLKSVWRCVLRSCIPLCCVGNIEDDSFEYRRMS